MEQAATEHARSDESIAPAVVEARVSGILPPRSFRRRWSLSDRRLRGELIELSSELIARKRRQPTSDDLGWWESARELLLVAANQASLGQVTSGFEALNAARRTAVEAYSPHEIRTEAIALIREAEAGKFSKWRCEAIKNLLETIAAEGSVPEPGDRVHLRKALLLRDQGAQNTHRRLDLVGRRYWQLLGTTVAAVCALVALSWSSPLQLVAVEAGETTEPLLNTWSVWLHAFALGALGASVSAALSLSKSTANGRVPDVRARTIPAVFRPAFGGAAAIGALAILAAGLLAGLTASNGTVLGLAFLAGFSERLIDTVSARYTQGDGS